MCLFKTIFYGVFDLLNNIPAFLSFEAYHENIVLGLVTDLCGNLPKRFYFFVIRLHDS